MYTSSLESPTGERSENGLFRTVLMHQGMSVRRTTITGYCIHLRVFLDYPDYNISLWNDALHGITLYALAFDSGYFIFRIFPRNT